MRRHILVGIAGVSLTLAAAPLFAHHAFSSEFDAEKQKDFQTKSSKLADETMVKISAVLDDAQKKTWKELTGDAFDTSKLFQPRTEPKKD